MMISWRRKVDGNFYDVLVAVHWMVAVIGRRKLRAPTRDWVAFLQFSLGNKLTIQIILFETWKNALHMCEWLEQARSNTSHIWLHSHYDTEGKRGKKWKNSKRTLSLTFQSPQKFDCLILLGVGGAMGELLLLLQVMVVWLVRSTKSHQMLRVFWIWLDFDTWKRFIFWALALETFESW